MTQSSQSTQKFHQQLEKAGAQLEKVSDDYLKVATNGKKSFNQLTNEQQKAVVQFHKMGDEVQSFVIAARECGQTLGDWSVSKFKEAAIDTNTWVGHLDYAKNKLNLLGTNTESFRGKIQVVGSAIQSYVGAKWDTVSPKIDMIKNKVNNLGNSIKNGLSNAISRVSNRLQSLGQAFDGIGGMITQSLGVIGVNSIKEMTIEASISRDRIFNLSYALMGANQSVEEFKTSESSLWKQMDEDTNKSLVSLDQLSQALSVVKLSTGATTDQLKEFEPILINIGQRAILMGKDGTEAVSLMQAAGKGLNGEFEMLKDNFGITKDKLKAHNWSGSADDVDGYTKALQECLDESGNVSGMMKTTYGRLTSLQKFWKLAGRSLGDDFLPYIDQALDSFINFADADKDGALDDGAKSWMKYAVGAGAVASGFVSLAPTITPVFAAFREVKGVVKDTIGYFAQFSGMALELGGKGIELFSSGLKNGAGYLGKFKDKLNGVKDYLSNFKLDNLTSKFDGLRNKIKNINFTNLKDKFADFRKTISGKFSLSNITQSFSSLKTKILEVPFKSFKTKLTDIKNAIKDFKFSTITDSISNFGTMLSTAGGKVKKFGEALLEEKSIKEALKAADIELAAAEGLALGPILLIIGAIIALGVAVYEVGKHFGWWKDIPTMLESVKAGLQRLWSAFVNNPDVQGFIKGLGDAWNSVTSAIGPVIDAVMEFLGINTKSGEEFDIVRMIIDGVGAAFHQVANAVRTAIGVFQTIYGVFQGIASFLAPYGQMIYDFLKPIVCILLGCSPGIVPALEKVQEVFQSVWSFIAGFIGSYVSTVVTIITTVITTIQSVIGVFAQLLTGQISLGEAIPMIWNLISNAFTTIGGTILNFITKWAGQLLTLAIRAATNFMNGIVNRIKNLPGKIYGFITSTASRIRDGAAGWANYARTAATNTYNGVVNNISGLPGKVYQEFIGIGNKIKEAFTHVVQQASNFASGIKNKILDILGIHSPGILQEKIGIEFTNIGVKSIGEKARLAYENAKAYAGNIVSGFESEDMSSLEVPTADISANVPNMNVSGVTPQLEAPDTSAITDTVTTAYDTMNNLVGIDLANLQYMNTQSFNDISVNEETMMKKIYDHVNTTLMKILKTNKSSLTSNVSATKTQLSKIRNSTKTVTGEMVTAWNGMKNSIVKAANDIESGAKTHFDSLGKTIGGFYGKLQNPSRWGTGPGPEEERRGTGRGVRASRLVNGGNAMRVMSKRLAGSTVAANNMPRTISVKSVQNNPTFKGLTDFISNGSTIDVRTLFETGVLSPNNLGGLSRSAFGAWENTAKPNIDKIKRTASKWSMKGPRIANRVSSGLTFHVSDFESGTPKIGMNDFINMAYALVNSTSYGYYADSSRYGNWLNALNHNEMNCSDGSDMLIALARTCGLPAEKVHCYWGTNSGGIAGVAGKGEGHFVARIGGRIMDSVSMRHGSLTSPKVHGYGTGPSPFKSLRESSDDSKVEPMSEELKLGGKLEIEMTHKFEGLPKGMDEAKLARMINEAPENEAFVKKLANNIRFQLADRKAKVRLERKTNRSKGLGA